MNSKVFKIEEFTQRGERDYVFTITKENPNMVSVQVWQLNENGSYTTVLCPVKQTAEILEIVVSSPINGLVTY